MFLGLNLIAWLFWLNLAAILASAGWAAYARRLPLLSAIGIAANIAAACLLWAGQGQCLLPQPSLVDYQPGMTLCPGQATKGLIIIPSPRSPGLAL